MSKANKVQIGGGHYKKHGIEPWDYITKNRLGYLEGNIVKYITRYRDKNGVEDLRKVSHYFDKLMEVEEERLTGLYGWIRSAFLRPGRFTTLEIHPKKYCGINGLDETQLRIVQAVTEYKWDGGLIKLKFGKHQVEQLISEIEA